MTTRSVPRFTTWLVDRLGPEQQREALLGNLAEQYQRGRSAMWYRREAAFAILAGCGDDIRRHPLLTVRALVLCWAGLAAVAAYNSWLSSLFWEWSTRPDTVWRFEFVRQLWTYYRVPFVAFTCGGCAATGWIVGRCHPAQRRTFVLLCGASLLVPAAIWGAEIIRLLDAGLPAFWDARRALMFHAVANFVLLPLSLIAGGLSDDESGSGWLPSRSSPPAV